MMKLNVIFLCGILFFQHSSTFCAGQQTMAYQQAIAQAGAMQADVIQAAQSGNLADVPGYSGGVPPESNLNDGSLEEATIGAASNNQASTTIVQNMREGGKFNTPDEEDFMQNADRAVQNPEKSMGGDIKITRQGSPPSIQNKVTCIEGGEEYQQSCTKYLEIDLRVTPEIGHYNPRWCIGHWKGGMSRGKYQCGGCRGGEYVIDQHKKVEVIREEWIDGCTALERQADKGLCRYESVEYGPTETRTIEGEPVRRNHWIENYQYICLKKAPAQDTPCSALSGRGCVQTKSTCIERLGTTCILWKQTYTCEQKRQQVISYRATGRQVPFCISGDCVLSDYESNEEMLDVLTQLSVLKQIQDDVQSNLGIFTGQVRACRKNCIGFRDCCTTGKGWGMSLHLAECTGEETELATWREKKRCILVGTYCAEKKLGVCIRKKTSFCCFGTKLSKLIQEQGRRQLGIGFGEPKCPDCRGLSPEELSRLDFSQMDLSELFEDIQKNIRIPENGQVVQETSLKKIKKNMKNLTSKLRDAGSRGESQ